MKKPLIIVLCLALLFAFAAVATAEDKTRVDVYDQQQELVKSVVFVIGSNEYFVNGQTPGVKMDAEPFIENSRTFVPIRYLSNALGVVDKYIGWESPTVTLDQPGMPVVELSVGKKQIKSDGQAKAMDVAPLLKEGRTYLPARFVAEALGYQVAWDGNNNAVICWPKGTEQPDISNVVSYVKGKSPGQQVEEPATPIVPEQPPVNTDDVVQFSGEPLNPEDYKVISDRKAIPYEFKQPGASIMYVTLDELRQKPVKLGNDEEGYMIFYDVKVTEDKVYVTQAQSDSTPTPARIILAKSNDVSVQRDNTIVEYSSNPFTHGYTISLDADPTPTKIEDVTHIMLLFDNEILAVENPRYKGAK